MRLAAAGRDTTKKARPRGLNENYGRELMELHTLGVDGGYTQADVVSAARAFTGWTVEKPRENGTFVFRPALHDAGEKIFLGHTLAAEPRHRGRRAGARHRRYARPLPRTSSRRSSCGAS